MPEQNDDGSSKQLWLAVSDGVIGAGVLVVLGALAGTWADAKLHTSPIFTILLLLAGGATGLIRLVRKTMALNDASVPKQKAPPADETSNSDKTQPQSRSQADKLKPRNPFDDFGDQG